MRCHAHSTREQKAYSERVFILFVTKDSQLVMGIKELISFASQQVWLLHRQNTWEDDVCEVNLNQIYSQCVVIASHWQAELTWSSLSLASCVFKRSSPCFWGTGWQLQGILTYFGPPSHMLGGSEPWLPWSKQLWSWSACHTTLARAHSAWRAWKLSISIEGGLATHFRRMAQLEWWAVHPSSCPLFHESQRRLSQQLSMSCCAAIQASTAENEIMTYHTSGAVRI